MTTTTIEQPAAAATRGAGPRTTLWFLTALSPFAEAVTQEEPMTVKEVR
jgi:hypothetical protein